MANANAANQAKTILGSNKSSIDALLETHSEIERKVYECLLDERVTRGDIVSIDHLQALSGFHISNVTAALTMLALSGLVKQGFDGCYRLVRNENCRS
ncbi:MAG: hypothetical protein KC777_17415 [Cyanobacteria bacterium HKST-UBA02]|nr:hypothetical protein [Cyanobacteria bacterium HKST-UBA02]